MAQLGVVELSAAANRPSAQQLTAAMMSACKASALLQKTLATEKCLTTTLSDMAEQRNRRMEGEASRK